MITCEESTTPSTGKKNKTYRPPPIDATMFKADILNMAGGKESGVDVRDALSICAESMSKSPETLFLCASSCVPKYDGPAGRTAKTDRGTPGCLCSV